MPLLLKHIDDIRGLKYRRLAKPDDAIASPS